MRSTVLPGTSRTIDRGHARSNAVRLAAGLATLACLGLTACGGSGSGSSVPLGPPVALAYASPEYDLKRDVFVPPLQPSYTGGAVTFSVAPPLPTGLVLDSTTGVISGRPTAAAPGTTYVVTASNAAGSVHADLDLEVHDAFDRARIVFALHSERSEISAWRYDAGTNTLVPTGTFSTGLLPIRAEVDPLGRFLYVACAGHERIAVHRIDHATGRLDPIELVDAEGATFDVVVDPSGRFLYKSNLHVGTIQAFLVDPDSGHLVPNGPSVPVPGPSGLTLSKDGKHLFAGTIVGDAVLHFALDEVTGQITEMLDAESAGDPVDLYYDDDTSRLYAVDFLANRLRTFLVDPIDGYFTLLFDTPTFGGPAAVLENAGELYVANHSDALVSRFKLDGPGGEPIPWTAEPLAGRPTQIVMLGEGLDAIVSLDDVGLLAQLSRDETDGALTWSDRRPTGTSITDVVVVPGPRAASLETLGVFTATSLPLELTSLRKTESGLETSPYGQSIGLDPARILVDDQNDRVFVVSRGSDHVASFAFDEDLGLTALEVTNTGYMPRDAALLPGGKYMLTLDANQVVLNSVQPDGSLVVLDSESVGSMPCHVALHPSGRHAYVTTDDDVYAFSVDARAGHVDRVHANGLSFAPGSAPEGIAIAPDGAHVVVVLTGAQALHVASIETITGELASVSTLTTGFGSIEPSFDAKGAKLLTVEPVDGMISLFALDAGGSLHLLSRADCGTDSRALALDRDGLSVYGAAAGSDSIEVLLVDGTGTTIAPDSQVQVGAGTAPHVVTTATIWRSED